MTAGAPKGTRRGGRKKGVANKKTQDVIDRLNDLGCDPIAGLAEIAMNSAEETLRLQANKELAQYIAPKRKAVEITGDGSLVISLESDAKSL